MPNVIYTIGHSTHSIEKLVNLLTVHHITSVADVRSYPYSRFAPQFNRENLQVALRTAGISYVFLGRELGARPKDRTCYVEGTVHYDRLARTKLFQEGLNRIVEGVRRHRIALLCAEKDPLTCHRAILVCRHLVNRDIKAQHILEDSQLESHDKALTRLLKDLDLPECDLFRNRDDVIGEAYNRRGQQIAYTENERLPEKPFWEVQR